MKTKTKPARNPTIFRGGADTKGLYGILHKLECELQELGVGPVSDCPRIMNKRRKHWRTH